MPPPVIRRACVSHMCVHSESRTQQMRLTSRGLQSPECRISRFGHGDIRNPGLRHVGTCQEARKDQAPGAGGVSLEGDSAGHQIDRLAVDAALSNRPATTVRPSSARCIAQALRQSSQETWPNVRHEKNVPSYSGRVRIVRVCKSSEVNGEDFQ